MLKRCAHIAGLALLLGVIFVPTARADTHFSVQIGVPVPATPVAVAPPGYVWQPAYRVWTGFGYRWVPGAWVPAPYVRGDRDWRDHGRDWDRRDWDRDRREWERHREWERRRDWERRRNWDRDEHEYWRR